LQKKLISAQKPDYAVLLLEAAVESNNELKDTAALLADCRRMLNRTNSQPM
jgi:hypothetical protein